MAYVITAPCIGVKDGSCVDACPVDCIYVGEDQFYIHPQECIDCGACVVECPVNAIYPEGDYELRRRWPEYVAKNTEFFANGGPRIRGSRVRGEFEFTAGE